MGKHWGKMFHFQIVFVGQPCVVICKMTVCAKWRLGWPGVVIRPDPMSWRNLGRKWWIFSRWTAMGRWCGDGHETKFTDPKKRRLLDIVTSFGYTWNDISPIYKCISSRLKRGKQSLQTSQFDGKLLWSKNNVPHWDPTSRESPESIPYVQKRCISSQPTPTKKVGY